jgi:hypothetical protein
MVVIRHGSLRKVSAMYSEAVKPGRKLRPRTNATSANHVPDGHIMCFDPTCGEVFPVTDDSELVCPQGHVCDLTEEFYRWFAPGGKTYSGLTPTRQGQIAEQVVQDLGDLGKYGVIDWWADTYNSPLDGSTNRGWGIEVKSVASRATNHDFKPGNPADKARKNKMARERKLKGIVGVLVILNYEDSTAEIYVRGMRRVRYFEKEGAPFATAVPFENPLASRELALAQAALAEAEMPF